MWDTYTAVKAGIESRNHNDAGASEAAPQAAAAPVLQVQQLQQRLQHHLREEFLLRRQWTDLLQHLLSLHKTRFHRLLEQAFGITAGSRTAGCSSASSRGTAPVDLDLQQPFRADLSMPLYCVPQSVLAAAQTSSVGNAEVTVMDLSGVQHVECLWGAEWYVLQHHAAQGCPCPDRVVVSGPVKLQWWSQQPDVLQVYLSSVRCEKPYGKLVWGPITAVHPAGVAAAGLEEGLQSSPLSGEISDDPLTAPS